MSETNSLVYFFNDNFSFKIADIIIDFGLPANNIFWWITFIFLILKNFIWRRW